MNRKGGGGGGQHSMTFNQEIKMKGLAEKETCLHAQLRINHSSITSQIMIKRYRPNTNNDKNSKGQTQIIIKMVKVGNSCL